MNLVNHEKAITMARVCNNYFQNYFSLQDLKSIRAKSCISKWVFMHIFLSEPPSPSFLSNMFLLRSILPQWPSKHGNAISQTRSDIVLLKKKSAFLNFDVAYLHRANYAKSNKSSNFSFFIICAVMCAKGQKISFFVKNDTFPNRNICS